MEKTFNLKSFMTKTANLDNEGSHGYFLAQQRAWMNCSKCKREKGKSAQEAWQECFDEFQKGDRKMSWLENYASDEVQNVKKESAVDYSEDVVKLASTGIGIDAAVNSALEQRLAGWRDWFGKKKPQSDSQQTTNQSISQPTPEAFDNAMNEKKRHQFQEQKLNQKDRGKISDSFSIKQQTKMLQEQIQEQNKTTYNILNQISKYIDLDKYDTDEIKKIISSIPNEKVKRELSDFNQYIDGVTNEFTKTVQRVSELTQNMMKTFINKGDFFDNSEENRLDYVPRASEKSQKQDRQHHPWGRVAQVESETVKLEEKYVLRRYDRGNQRWTYFSEGQNGTNLINATRFTKSDAMSKAKELAGQNLYYIVVKDNENDWSQI